MHRRLRQIVRRSRRLLVGLALLAYLGASFPIPLPASWAASPCHSLTCHCAEELHRRQQCCCYAPPTCSPCQGEAASSPVKSCCRNKANRSSPQRVWVVTSLPCNGGGKLQVWLSPSVTMPPPCVRCVFDPHAVDWLRPWPLSALSWLAPPAPRPPRLSA